uniref:Polyketide synthase n=1 Tax=Peronospora matthiolae TaxID=2874970 RepID=A0AAV1V309_9STRA
MVFRNQELPLELQRTHRAIADTAFPVWNQQSCASSEGLRFLNVCARCNLPSAVASQCEIHRENCATREAKDAVVSLTDREQVSRTSWHNTQSILTADAVDKLRAGVTYSSIDCSTAIEGIDFV